MRFAPHEIRAIEVGDLDGDQRNDVVLWTRAHVMSPVAYAGARSGALVVADVDGDGARGLVHDAAWCSVARAHAMSLVAYAGARSGTLVLADVDGDGAMTRSR